ncbi:MAG: DNA repair protein RecO, partial [Thermodesulfobacteriota bacterium]
MKSSEALLLRKRPHGDADYILTLFTREFGKINGLAKNAKTSSRRFGKGMIRLERGGRTATQPGSLPERATLRRGAW